MRAADVGPERTVLLQFFDLLLCFLLISLAVSFRFCLCQAPPTLFLAIWVFSFAGVDLRLESALVVKLFLD